MHPVQRHYAQPAAGTFTTQELQRLAAYRAAVVAGFYNDDWDGAAESTPRERPASDATPETPEQLAR